jgi:N-sulfoglucosamine sulfohydrolase
MISFIVSRLFSGALLGALVLGSVVAGYAQPAKPNLVIIIADDCTYTDMEVYGGQAKTPSLMKLAEEGMKFSHCFQAAPMCSPTRHNLYTGLYPVKSGAYPNHTMAYDWVKSLPHYLASSGYRSFLSGKTHINPRSVFPFEYSSQGNNPDMDVLDKALEECAKNKTPFLLVAASNEPHEPYNKGDASAYPPASLKLPPVLVDTPETRDAFSKYLAEITYFDGQVGQVLGLLEKHGQKENTLVVVLSEQGNAFPFAKWTCYDVGLRSGCIVRWPGKVKPGSATDALVEYVDVVPTFLEAASLPRPKVLDGSSFLPVLTGKASRHKDYVFGIQTTRGVYFAPPHYGIRSARDERYRYIWNFTPEVEFKCAATRDEVFDSWKRVAEAGDARAAKLVREYQHRPAEELYDCVVDPWNRTNLIAEARFSATRDKLRDQLDKWMKAQGDLGQETELKALERMPSHSPEGIARKKKKNKGKTKE